jgi:hypothetical protein
VRFVEFPLEDMFAWGQFPLKLKFRTSPCIKSIRKISILFTHTHTHTHTHCLSPSCYTECNDYLDAWWIDWFVFPLPRCSFPLLSVMVLFCVVARIWSTRTIGIRWSLACRSPS